MRMDHHRPNLIIISISMIYWYKTSVVCWKFDGHNSAGGSGSSGGGGGGVGAGGSGSTGDTSPNGGGVPNANGVSGVNSGVVNILNTNHDILYACPLNSMCQCASLPNETSTLIEINCNDVSLYKFPEFLHSSVRFIEISKAHIQSVEDETFQGLRLETLKLIDNKLQEISEKSFITMSHTLMSLDLSGNELQHIPLDAIRNMHTLTKLMAQRNHITSLEGNWGNLADSLRSLHVSGNSISEVTSQPQDEHHKENPGYTSSSYNHIISRPLSKLRKLLWLDISNNRISHISSAAIPRSLLTVELSRNLLPVFPQQLFEHLHDLRMISLRDNLIRSVSFREVRIMRIHLERLDLSLNLIDDVHPELFMNNYSDVHIKALNLEKNFLKSIPSKLFYGTGIVHLVLAFNEIARIHIEAFEGIENSLEYLDLERNELQSIPLAIKTLNKLKCLYLTSNLINQLTNLPENSANLQVLSLSGNNFTKIPAESLRNFTELSYLNMGYNKISEIPDNTFVGWGNQLQTILLRNNKVTQLTYGSFNGLDSINEISLSFNDIHYVSPNVFENISKTLKILELSFGIYREDFPTETLSPLTELMWLGLDNNNLKTVTGESLATLSELSYINLSFNRIINLSKNLFIAHVHNHLVEIDLSFNLIDKIESNTFDSLEELQTVNLGSNKIRLLEKLSFHNLPRLTFIDLSHNKIKNISDDAFSILPRLMNIDLSQNALCTVSLRMFNVNLNSSVPLKLNMSQNKITVFDDDLSSFLYIQHLDMSHNLLSNSLSFSSLGNVLRVLNLMDNSLSVLGNHAFGDLEFLEVLNLSKNNITSLRRRSFQGLNSLQDLNLCGNRLEQLQVEQFSNLKKLRILNLRNNKLRALPREVFLNTRLEYLDISNNQLTVWPVPAFSDVGFTLRNIQFSGNNLEYLDSMMFINSQFLYDLNLSHNKITVLPDNTFTFLNNLTNLDLSYNPLVTSNLKEVFLHTPRVRKLNIRAMGLYVLPQLNLHYLTELDVSGNYLQELYSFHEMRLLRILNLANNKIVNVSSIAEHLPTSIRILDLSHNPIRRITSHDVGALRFVDELHMFDIKVSNPSIFGKLRNLKILHTTSSQNLGELVARVAGLQELHVHVVESKIRDTLFAKLINNTKLNLIEVYGRNVHTISSNAFDGLARTHKLKIRIKNTKISDLPPGIFYSLKYVSHLTIDVSDNRIAALSPDSFYPNASSWDAVGTRSVIGGLDIANNPMQCDCGLVWLGHWLRRWLRESAQINLIQKDEMKKMLHRARANTCYDPTTGRKLAFLEIFPEDLLCHASALSSSAYSEQKQFLLSFIVILPLILVTLTVTL